MPQLDTSTFVSQIFWLIVSFLTLWFAMSFFVVPRIAEIIEERRQKIETDIQKARQINKKAEQILNRYEMMISKAKLKTDEEVAAEKERIEASDELKRAEISRYLEQKIIENEAVIKRERAQTIQAVHDISVVSADMILRKIGLK